MKWKKLYFLLSAIVIVPGIISLILFGLKPGIDFTGGTEIELFVSRTDAQPVSANQLQMVAAVAQPQVKVEQKSQSFLFRLPPVEPEERQALLAAISEQGFQFQELRYETVGPVLGKELLAKTIAALLISATGITLYVAYRFSELKFGVCAVLAMLHDSLVLLGSFSLLGHFFGVEIDVLFVTAMLTILSFSVHDTIVVYDRIRELRRHEKTILFETLVNKAVTETLSRSINNSMTIIFMLITLWLLGGETIQYFVLALLIGTITGTYSSTFTAAPLLLVWDEMKKRFGKRK